jgi:hypothetical protein
MFIRNLFLFGPEDSSAGGGGAGPAWHESIVTKGADGSESLTDFATWKDKAPAPLVKFITDNMTAARAKTEGMIKVPGEGATAEEIAAYHKAIGVPEKEDEYGYQLPEGLAEDAVDKAKIDAWRKEFKAAGIPKATAEKILNKYLGDEVAGMKARSEEYTKALEAERTELGKRFPKIDETVALANSLAKRNGIPESLKKAIEGGAFDPKNDKAFWGADALEAFAWAAKASGEDAGAGGGGTGSAANALATAKDIIANKDNPKYAKYHAGDPAVMAEVQAAYQAATTAGV